MAAVFAFAVLGERRAASAQIFVAPDTDLAQLAARSPPGSSFVLLAGKHYAGDIVPKDHQSFEGQAGTVLSGAVRLGPFSKVGRFWKASGPSPLPMSHGSCDIRLGVLGETCLLREDLFVDGVRLERVESLERLREATWYQMRPSGDVLLSFDPASRLVEISNRSSAFKGAAQNVTISHLTIEQYASAAQHGAIEGASGSGWIVSDNFVRFNSGTGIRTGNGMRVQSNVVSSNGQLGIGSGGDDLLVEANIIAENNTHRFKVSWEAGGTKFWSTNNLLFLRNCVRDNDGHGIWTDTDNRNAAIIGNWSINNWGVGIFHEISGPVIIADNVVAWNGSRDSSPDAAQIFITGSIDGLILRNRVEVAPNRGDGIVIAEEGRPNETKIIHDQPKYIARGNIVMQNQTKYFGKAGASGFEVHRGDASPLTLTNRFENNEVIAKDTGSARFEIGRQFLRLAEAQARGQEKQSNMRLEETAQSAPPECPAGLGIHP